MNGAGPSPVAFVPSAINVLHRYRQQYNSKCVGSGFERAGIVDDELACIGCHLSLPASMRDPVGVSRPRAAIRAARKSGLASIYMAATLPNIRRARGTTARNGAKQIAEHRRIAPEDNPHSAYTLRAEAVRPTASSQPV